MTARGASFIITDVTEDKRSLILKKGGLAMKGLALVLVAISFLSFSCTRDLGVTPLKGNIRALTQSEQQVSRASTSFGFQFFHELHQSNPQENQFTSPLSVSMALGMTLNGADGITETAMQSTLGLDMDRQEINKAYNSLIELLITADSRVQFDIANSIWYRDTFQVEADFLDVNKKYFDAAVRPLDFNNPNSVNIINNWVSEQTNEKIDKIVDRIQSSTIMFLINAIYFNGTWTFEFDKEKTQTEGFQLIDGQSTDVDMMVQTNDKFRYFENEMMQAIDLPYGQGHFRMTVFLPRDEMGLNELIEQLDKTSWKNWIGSFSQQKGTLHLPKFKMKYDKTLNDVLSDMGMAIAFDKQNANFARISKNASGNIYIDNVKHKTFVDVNEEGTEAAAVTSVELGVTSVGPGPEGFVMRVDHPFLFFIREHSSDTILFIGKILDPTAS